MPARRMIRFAVYESDQLAETWPLHNAVLIDKDEAVVAGQVSFDAGHVVCHRTSRGATALRLVYRAGRSGTLALRTCLLPQRDEPYILSVELARHRIAMFLSKAEEWQMIDLDDEHPALTRWEEARRLFTRAMVEPDPVAADRAGRRSLSLAIAATEQLAVAHAEILLMRRFGDKPAASTALGVHVAPDHAGPALRNLVDKHMRLVSVPLDWKRLSPAEGDWDWDTTDDWVGWCTDHGKRVIGGPLIDLGPEGLPQWVVDSARNYKALRDLIYDHAREVVFRYGDHIGMWSIGTSINTNLSFSLKPHEMVELVRTLSLVVREGRRGRRVVLELDGLWADHVGDRPESVDPLAFIEQLVQAGLRLDAIGLRMQFGDGRFGRSTRDLMAFSRMIDRFFMLEIPLIITQLGVPDDNHGAAGGWWREGWTPERQAMWASHATMIAMSKPHVESVIWTDLYEHGETIPEGGALIDVQGQPRPVLGRFVGLAQRLRVPLAGDHAGGQDETGGVEV